VPSRRRLRILVSGRVQGVWFRASTREQALALGLDGDVRNLADGRVEIHAEGPTEAVDALVAWCRVGPSGARVAQVEVEEEPPVGAGSGFRVARE
jgi:acylphosphatase